jgi:hypothetical protein
MTLSTTQQDAVEAAVARYLYFVQFDFLSDTVYLCSANQTVTWNNHDWIGMGAISQIDAFEENVGMTPTKLNFTLALADASLLSISMGSVNEYRGRAAKMYFCPLDEQFRIIDTPQICWRGIMDTMSVGVDKEIGTAVMKCETSAFGLKRRPLLRMNKAQQSQRYPNDTGFNYLTSLIANPQIWLSKKFQSI